MPSLINTIGDTKTLNYSTAVVSGENLRATIYDWTELFTAKWGVDNTIWLAPDANTFRLRFPASGNGIETKTGALTNANLSRIVWDKTAESGSGRNMLYTGNSSANSQALGLYGTQSGRSSGSDEVTFACVNDFALSWASFTNSSLTTVASWGYVGWLLETDLSATTYPRGLVRLSSVRSSFLRPTTENSTLTTNWYTSADTVTSPVAMCSGGNSTDIIMRDSIAGNYGYGKLCFMARVPNERAIGDLTRDSETGLYYRVIGTWGTGKIAMLQYV
jgi:hypothetical protein